MIGWLTGWMMGRGRFRREIDRARREERERILEDQAERLRTLEEQAERQRQRAPEPGPQDPSDAIHPMLPRTPLYHGRELPGGYSDNGQAVVLCVVLVLVIVGLTFGWTVFWIALAGVVLLGLFGATVAAER